ncbi:MAG TPA: hypothetical protein PKV19_07855, partial [Anaerolineales bacterium]|nr:hypothetical protein [Anaerolineales bacterium]
MPSKKKTPNKNTAGDNSIIINGDMNNSTIIIGDNSSLNKSAPTQQSERPSERVLQPVVPSESTNSKLSPFLCYAKENSAGVREFRERLRAESWVDPWFDEEDILPG